jgi:hypothetical protein
LRGAANIALAIGCVIHRHKMARHFHLDISEASFSFTRKSAEIAAEAAIDGIYVVRTNLPVETCDDTMTVRSYKSLAVVERAFRCLKTVDLQVRPIYHWLAGRVRAHVLLCMLAYHLEWHMRQTLAPMMFEDADKPAAEALRTSVVARAQRSPTAVQKQTTKLTRIGCRCTASRPCSPIWRPSHEIPSLARSRPTIRSLSSPDQRSTKPCSCSASVCSQ